MAQRRGLLKERIADAVDPTNVSDCLRIGLSPHAPYSVEPHGYRRCLAEARRPGFMERRDPQVEPAPDFASVGRDRGTVHAVQLEMAQALYMDESPPFAFREERARAIRPILRALLEAALVNR